MDGAAGHPPAALPLGTCLWKPTGLPSRSLQRLQTLGHYREQGQAADLHNTHNTQSKSGFINITSRHVRVSCDDELCEVIQGAIKTASMLVY